MRPGFIRVASIFLAVVLCIPPVQAAPQFRTSNPDVGKYDFAISYISALGYLNNINKRWKKSSPKKSAGGDDVKLMRAYVAYLIKDNGDLRIAKNYLTRYLQSPNALVRKSADMFIASCVRLLAINDKEKEIWDQWYAVKSNKLGGKANERAFLKAQQELSYLRKDAYKSVVEATIMLSKVLKSERNKDERGHLLALTDKQRDKLIKNIDVYGKDMIEWGLKPGQDHIEASVGVLREVLEDTIYTTLDDTK